MKSIFCVSVEDVQYIALKKIGRRLTDDELYTVQKGVQFGLECWDDVVTYSIREAVAEK